MRAVEATVEIQLQGVVKLIHCEFMGLNKLRNTTTRVVDE
jgi:hypothetical protein